MIFKHNFIWFIFILIIAVSCTALKKSSLPSAANLPSAYSEDSTIATNDSLRSPRDFFKDANLVALINIALQNNFDLLRAIQRIEFARANYSVSKAAFLPSLNGAATYGIDKFSRTTMNGIGNYDTNLSPNVTNDLRIPNPTPDIFVGLRTSWEVGIWGKYRNLKKSGYQRLLASEMGKNLVQTSIVAEVASLYYRLLALDAELEIINRNLILQQTAVDKIDVLKQGARANELAVQQFIAQLLDTKALLEMKKQEIVRTENLLNLLLGRFPTTIARGQDIISQKIPTKIYTGIPSDLLYQRPDVKQAELLLGAANADLGVAKAAFFPSLTIGGYAGYNSFSSNLLFSPSSVAYGAVAGLIAPIFNKNQIKANYRRNRAEQMEAFYTYQKTIVSGYQEVVTNIKGIENYQKVYDLKAQEVEALQKAVSASNDLFFAGSTSYLDVITVRRYVLLTELELTDSKKEQFLYMIELYKSLGGGWK